MFFARSLSCLPILRLPTDQRGPIHGLRGSKWVFVCFWSPSASWVQRKVWVQGALSGICSHSAPGLFDASLPCLSAAPVCLLGSLNWAGQILAGSNEVTIDSSYRWEYTKTCLSSGFQELQVALFEGPWLGSLREPAGHSGHCRDLLRILRPQHRTRCVHVMSSEHPSRIQ